MRKNLSDVPLASSFYDFKSPALAEAYNDSDLTPVGAAFLEDIAALKDQLTSSGFEGKYIKRLAPNKSGHYYLRKLTRSERKKYLKNFKTQMRSIPVIMWLDSVALDTDDFIGSAFTWDNTPEGHQFWMDLDGRLRWVTNILND